MTNSFFPVNIIIPYRNEPDVVHCPSTSDRHVDTYHSTSKFQSPARHTLCLRRLSLNSFVISPFPLQRNGEQYIFARGDLNHILDDMVARAQLTAKFGPPVRHVPLQAPRRYDGRLAQGQDAHVFRERVPPRRWRDVALRLPRTLLFRRGDVVVVADADPMRPSAPRTTLQQERQPFAAEQVDPPVALVGPLVLLEQVQVVQLTEALVYAAAEAAETDDVPWRLGGGGGSGVGSGLVVGAATVMLADMPDRLGEVCRVLVRVMDDLALAPWARGHSGNGVLVTVFCRTS